MPSPSAGPRRWTRSSRPSTEAAVPDLHGKVALITGVGRVGQIGHAVAKGFAEAGATLVLADVNAVGLADRVREFKAGGHRVASSAGDLTTPAAARAAVAVARQQFGGLDIVVNVAGGLVNYGPALELTPEQLEKELAVNVKTTFYVSQAAVPALLERGGGAIVNFASVAVLKPQSQMASYIAAKSAVAGLTRAFAREFRDQGVRVNAVAPGTMKTADNLAQMKDAKVRWVELDQLVTAVLFLASDDAQAVTGEILPVAGDV
ncbi:MAG: 3-oxoacyl-ACP reductase [Gemmatimonadetes bacterium]|nr:MAG: 3-oxoacyl-ACP reductase [Gemmatimonadota bacterium]